MIARPPGHPTRMAVTTRSGPGPETTPDTREFAVAVVGLGGRAVALHVAGELDLSTAPRLRAQIDRALEDGSDALVVDLSHVTFIDSVALAVLVAAHARLASCGRLAVVARTPFVQLVLEATGLDGILDVFSDRSAAKAFVRH